MKTFSLSEMKQIAKDLFSEAVAAVQPSKGIRERLFLEKNRLLLRTEGQAEKVFDLDRIEKIYLIGAGKASASMARTVEEILGDRIAKGIIVSKHGHLLPLKKVESIEAGHPLPDHQGLAAARKIQALLKDSGPRDLVFFLLSGGGSALLPYPANGIALEEKQDATQRLLACGADIKEINTVRKHISGVKGGRLGRWAYPSTVVSLILSDVVGDPLESIGSGPTVADPSTFSEAVGILTKYDLFQEVAPSIRGYLLSGEKGEAEETPKPGDPVFEKVFNVLIGSNLLALQAARKKALELGFNTLLLSSSITGDTGEASRFHCAIAKEVLASGNPVSKPACIISGGETTVMVKGNGLGGRNQEFGLTAALEISGLENVVLLSAGTDGTDGPTDAAGAIADGTTCERARLMGLDPKIYLEDNNAYPFFKRLGDLLITGPTQTNVMDIRILLVN